MPWIIALGVVIAVLLLIGLVYDLRQRRRGSTSSRVDRTKVQQARDEARKHVNQPDQSLGGF